MKGKGRGWKCRAADAATRSSSSPLYNALSSRSLVSFPSAVQLSRIVSGMLARDVKWRGIF
eukprot:scaffold27615_cov139-Skeletonema_marinoi.AAC.3